MDNDSECLFSFEVYVKDIEYLDVPCYIPAIAFRLLDYPTVIIYSTQVTDIEEMKDKLDGYSQDEKDLYEISKLKNQSGGYNFRKGKSCLLRQKFERLEALLDSVPLYITILDCWADRPKLIGSCMIPLQNLISQINDVFKQFGNNSPANGQWSGKYTIRNLIGTSIGKINLELKLTCFGYSLLQHVHLKSKGIKTQIDMLLDPDLLAEKTTRSRKVPPFENVLSFQQRSPEVKEVDRIVIPATGNISFETESKQQPCCKQYNKAVQYSSIPREKKPRRRQQQISVQNNSYHETIYNNIICPPPLYMNLAEQHATFKNTSDVNEKYVVETDLQSFDSFTDEEPEIEVLKPKHENKYSYNITKMTKDVNKQSSKFVHNKEDQSKANPNMNTAMLTEMPVLCSLLKEITTLSNTLFSYNKVDVDVEKKKTKTVGTTTTTNILLTPPPPEKKQISKQKSPHDVSHARTEKNKKSIILPNRTDGKKKKKKPSKKLIYGFTRTQRLRYQMSHKNELLPTDSIELHRQVDFVTESHDDKDVATTGVLKEIELKNPKQLEETREENHPIVHINDVSDQKDNGLTEIIGKQLDEQAHVSITLPSPDIDLAEDISKQDRTDDIEDSFHNQPVPEKKPGFYSPIEPRSISVSELGIFDDLSTWQSRDMSRGDNYADEAFYSDNDDNSIISGTSSVSLPEVSSTSDKTSKQSIIADLEERPITRHSSRHSYTQPRINSRTATRTNSSLQRSQISTTTISHDSKTHSFSPTRDTNTRSNSRSISRYPRSNSQNEDTDSRRSSRVSITSMTSVHSERLENSRGSIDSLVKTAAPVHSSHSPVKSKHSRRKQISSDEMLVQGSVTTLTSSEKNL